MAEETRLLSMFVGLLALLAALAFSIVSITTSHWYDDGTKRYGLWIECNQDDGVCSELPSVHDMVYAARAFTIMAAIALLALVPTAIYTVTVDGGKYKLLIGILLICQAVLQIIGVATYTGYRKDETSAFDKKYWGWSFELAWASAVNSLFGGVCFLLAGTVFTGSRQYQYKHSV